MDCAKLTTDDLLFPALEFAGGLAN